MVNLLELCKNLEQKIERLERENENLKALKIKNSELKESKLEKFISTEL